MMFVGSNHLTATTSFPVALMNLCNKSMTKNLPHSPTRKHGLGCIVCNAVNRGCSMVLIFQHIISKAVLIFLLFRCQAEAEPTWWFSLLHTIRYALSIRYKFAIYFDWILEVTEMKSVVGQSSSCCGQTSLVPTPYPLSFSLLMYLLSLACM